MPRVSAASKRRAVDRAGAGRGGRGGRGALTVDVDGARLADGAAHRHAPAQRARAVGAGGGGARQAAGLAAQRLQQVLLQVALHARVQLWNAERVTHVT